MYKIPNTKCKFEYALKIAIIFQQKNNFVDVLVSKARVADRHTTWDKNEAGVCNSWVRFACGGGWRKSC